MARVQTTQSEGMGRSAASADPLRGVALMFASTVLFAAMHTMIRHVSDELHAFEIAFFRTLFGLIFVLPWFLRLGLQPLRTRHLPMHVLRALFNVVAMLAFFYALTQIPLAEVTALGFTAPIFAALLAGLILHEHVHARRWIAIGTGFLGVVLVLRPGFEAIGIGQLMVLVSSVAWACALMTIKRLGETDSSITIITYMSLLMIPLSFGPAAMVWQWPSLELLAWLMVIGLIGGAGQWLMTEALMHGDASMIMPVDFCKLPWTALFGYLAFSQVPDLFTFLGGAVIFASTTYLALRERAARRPGAEG